MKVYVYEPDSSAAIDVFSIDTSDCYSNQGIIDLIHLELENRSYSLAEFSFSYVPTFDVHFKQEISA